MVICVYTPPVVARDRQAAWDEAGRRNPMFYVATDRTQWDPREFFASGEALLQQRVDPWLAKRRLDRSRATAVEIGTGVGRLGRGLAARFSQVTAFDLAPSMVAKAQELNADKPNLKFAVNSGNDLPGVAPASSDFVLCVWVFQHIPKLEIIEDYVAEIGRVLKPNGSFVLQIQGSRFPWPYGSLRNYLVSTGRWTRLLTFLRADATIAEAFPGILLELETLSQMCRRHQLAIVETAPNDTPGSFWVYGQKVNHE